MYNPNRQGPESAGIDRIPNNQTEDEKNEEALEPSENLVEKDEKSENPSIDTEREEEISEQTLNLEKVSQIDKENIPQALKEIEEIKNALENAPKEFPKTELLQLLEKQQKMVAALEQQKDELIEKSAIQETPKAVAISTDNGENQRTAINLNKEKIGTEIDQEIDKEDRKELIENLTKEAVEDFSDTLKNNWHTRDAVNLETVLDQIKIKVPEAIEKRTGDFIEGTTDILPHSIWLRWKSNSFFESLANKPNRIKELTLSFDDQVVPIATAENLRADKEGENDKKPDQKNSGPTNNLETAGL